MGPACQSQFELTPMRKQLLKTQHLCVQPMAIVKGGIKSALEEV